MIGEAADRVDGIRFDRVTEADRDVLREVNAEYIAWVLANVERDFGHSSDAVIGMPLAQYVEGNLGALYAYGPPQGAFYLGRVDGGVAAMGGLRPLTEGACELKRIYVRPAYRGLNLGAKILERLLEDAREFGYDVVRLDTGPFMKSAIRIYEAHGFVERSPYPGVEISDLVHGRWCFMERKLSGGKAQDREPTRRYDGGC